MHFDFRDALIIAALVGPGITAGAIAGFGGMVLTLAAGSLLYPLDQITAIALLANLLISAYVLGSDLKHVDRNVLLKLILPFMVPGAIAGALFRDYLIPLPAVLGAFLLVLIPYRYYRERRMQRGNAESDAESLQAPGQNPSRSIQTAPARLWTLGAGLVQGWMNTGGPLLVYGLSQAGLSPRSFRATLMALWTFMNTGLMIGHVITGEFAWPQMKQMGLILPTLPFFFWLGNSLHHRIPAHKFNTVIYGILTALGALLIFRSLW